MRQCLSLVMWRLSSVPWLPASSVIKNVSIVPQSCAITRAFTKPNIPNKCLLIMTMQCQIPDSSMILGCCTTPLNLAGALAGRQVWKSLIVQGFTKPGTLSVCLINKRKMLFYKKGQNTQKCTQLYLTLSHKHTQINKHSHTEEQTCDKHKSREVNSQEVVRLQKQREEMSCHRLSYVCLWVRQSCSPCLLPWWWVI